MKLKTALSAASKTLLFLLLVCAPAWAAIAHQKVFVQQFIFPFPSSTTNTFTGAANAPNDAVVIGVFCGNGAQGDKPTNVTLSASGWTFTQLGTISGSFGGWEALFGAIAPNTSSTTFTVAWTVSAACSSFSGVGDEFSGADTTGGTTTFDATAQTAQACSVNVTTGNANDAVWGACWGVNATTTVGSGYTQGGNDGNGDWSEYKITTDAAGTSETVNFVNSGSFMEAVTIKPASTTPTISSLTPNSGAVGSAIVIAGTNHCCPVKTRTESVG